MLQTNLMLVDLLIATNILHVSKEDTLALLNFLVSQDIMSS